MKHYPKRTDEKLEMLACKFEKMSESTEPATFKKSEILLLTDYYEYENILERAIGVINFGITQFHQSSELLVRKTRLLLYNNHFNQAVAELNRKKKTNLKSSQLDLLRVEVLIVEEKFEEAITILQALKYQYSKTRKVLSEVFYLESLAYERMKRYDLAFDALSEVLWINPSHQDAQGKVWMATELSKKYNESIFLNSFLLEKEHYSAITWFNIGHAFYSASQYKKAIEAFNFCIIINEDFESAYLDMAEVSMLLGMFQMAAQKLDIAIDKFKLNEIEVFIQHGECLLKCGEPRAARVSFLKGQAIDPFDPDLLFLLGESFRLENNFESAIVQYSRTLEMDDSLDHVYLSLAKVYFHQTEFDKAEENFQAAIEWNPNQSEYRSDFARFYLNIGENELSESILSIGMEEVPCVKVQYHYGAILMINGKDQDSLETLGNALRGEFSQHEEIFEFAPELSDHPKIKPLIEYFRGEK